jgi:hypothetical protein
MYGSYDGIAFRRMPGCLDKTGLRDNSLVQHRLYHFVVAGGHTFDFADQALEPRTQSGGFDAVRRIRIDSDNHFTKLGSSSWRLYFGPYYYSVVSIAVYSLYAHCRRPFDIEAAGSHACLGTLVSYSAVLSYVRLGICNKPQVAPDG